MFSFAPPDRQPIDARSEHAQRWATWTVKTVIGLDLTGDLSAVPAKMGLLGTVS